MVLYVTKNRGKLLIFGKVGCLWQCVVRMFLQPLSPLNVLDRNGQQTDKKLQINDLWLFLLPESPASKTSKVR